MPPLSVTYVIDDGEQWRVAYQIGRRGLTLVAQIPKGAAIDDVVLFCANVAEGMRRKLAELEREKDGP